MEPTSQPEKCLYKINITISKDAKTEKKFGSSEPRQDEMIS